MAKSRNDGVSGLKAPALIERLKTLLSALPESAPVGREEIRREVRSLAEVLEGSRHLSTLRLKNLTSARGARDRILAYLKLFPGEVVEGRELQVVAGIQEFARRIRELRVQFGYRISTGTTDDSLRPDEYRLESTEPNAEAAQTWKTLNEIRRRKGLSGMDRALELLKAFVGRVVTGEQIKYVAKIRSAERRVRQLRTEHGWRIVTRNTGRPSLANDEYVLETLEQLPEHDRRIPDGIYDEVLERDGFSCRKCGWSVDKRSPSARKQFLEVHHVVFHHKGGANDVGNLVTLCNIHHDDVHRRELSDIQLRDWLNE